MHNQSSHYTLFRFSIPYWSQCQKNTLSITGLTNNTMHRITVDQLSNSDLFVDAIYEGQRSGKMNADPMPILIEGIGNQGGFRYCGSAGSPKLIVLTSSFNDPDWPDELNPLTGILTYYGDNKKPGRALHETPRYGNSILRNMYNAIHSKPAMRISVPPILVFGGAGTWRDVRFLGLAVPGAAELDAMEDLIAVWKISDGQRFQNYRASLTILNVGRISREWLVDIRNGIPFSDNCPGAWRQWHEEGKYLALKAESTIEHRCKAEQLPEDEKSNKIIQAIHDYFLDKPSAFEACAASLTRMMDHNFISFDMTRPTRDGGRDAIGLYRVGQGESAILIDFALEAKCYDMNNSVGVKEVSRLISRLRHRQFGVLVTTSYLHSQAYREIKEDGHPVVIVSARDIVKIMSRAGLGSESDVIEWLQANYPKNT